MELQILMGGPNVTELDHVRTVCSTSPLVKHIDIVTAREEFYEKLKNNPAYFVIVHQDFITDLSLLPRDHFIILTPQPDRHMVKAARQYGIRGYFLEHPLPLEVYLLTALTLQGERWSLDPALSSWAFDEETPNELPLITALLTDREQEFFQLWNEKQQCDDIAKQMDISKKTAKKHLENIRRKLREYGLIELMK